VRVNVKRRKSPLKSSQHSTNTRLTDVEIFEQRTPLILLESQIRRGSGGRGKFVGGDGLRKTFEAREPVNFSIVSQRRVFSPKGLEGGEDGARGKNTWFKRNQEGGLVEINVGSNGIASLAKGDRVRIETPGGGGWGLSEDI
jgi:5-oxoprolinase (ATP-hydrolysing)